MTEACFSVRSLSPSRRKPYIRNFQMTEAYFSVRSLSPSMWKPYTKNFHRTEACLSVWSLSLSKWNPDAKSTLRARTYSQLNFYRRVRRNLELSRKQKLILGLILLTKQEETYSQSSSKYRRINTYWVLLLPPRSQFFLDTSDPI